MSEHPRLKPSKDELDHYGIECIPADIFVWRGYRYTRAQDAVAAAKRAGKE